MAQDSSPEREQVVDTMIALIRPSKLHGIIIAGGESMDFYLSLRRRGYLRVATPATCSVAGRLHGFGLITGRDTIGTLAQVSPFLSSNAAIAVLVQSHEGEVCMKVRGRLQQMGFRIEAGVRCQRGLVLSACRFGRAQVQYAA